MKQLGTARASQKRIFRLFCALAIGVLGIQISQSKTSKKITADGVATERTVKSLGRKSSQTHAELLGKVVKVSDGDTIQVYRSGKPEKIRLIGIDAPEKKQAFGERARQVLAELVAGKEVRVEVFGQDRYGRSLGRVWADTDDINLKILQDGLAWYYRHFERDLPEEMRSTYAQAEATAKAEKKGLWQDEVASLTPPWEFRQERKLTSKRADK